MVEKIVQTNQKWIDKMDEEFDEKFCIDCVHHNLDYDSRWEVHFCHAPVLIKIDLVRGPIWGSLEICEERRKVGGLCGPEGKLFKRNNDSNHTA